MAAHLFKTGLLLQEIYARDAVILHPRRENVVRCTDLFGNMAFKNDINEKSKPSTSGQHYFGDGVPGFAGEPRLDPVLSLATYLLVRGDDVGYLLAPFAKGGSCTYEIRTEMRLNDKVFLEDLR